MSERREHIFSSSEDAQNVSPKEALENKLTAALIRYKPYEVQELVIEALQDKKLTPNPKQFARTVADLINLMCGPEANPVGKEGPREGDHGLNVLWKCLHEFYKKNTFHGSREELLTQVRELDLRN